MLTVCRSDGDMLVLGGDTQLTDAEDKLNRERRVKGNEENESRSGQGRDKTGCSASVSVDSVSCGGIATSSSHTADRGGQRVRHDRELPPPQPERGRERERGKEVTCTATGAATGVDHFGEIAVEKAFCMAASAIEQGDLLRAGMLTDADVC